MSSQLEIFQDASIYTLETNPNNGLINIPLDINDVSIFVRTNTLIPIQSQLISSGLIDSSNLVNVLDKYGNNITGNLTSINNEVSVITEGSTIIIKKPILVRAMTQGKVYKIENLTQSVIVKGINSKVSWLPLYNLYLNEKEVLININLLAMIKNTGEQFDVNRLTLSLRSYYNLPITINPQVRMMAREALTPETPSLPYYTTASTEELPKALDESKIYLINRSVTLNKEVSMPLWTRQVNISRIYFFFIGDTKVYYGYEIQDTGTEFFPAGTVRVYNADLTSLKQFKTTGSLKRKIRFIVGDSLDVIITPNIQTNDQGVTEFDLVINNYKSTPILLKIIQKVKQYKRIISELKYTEDRDWGEVIWDLQVNPGVSTIKGAFTIVYS